MANLDENDPVDFTLYFKRDDPLHDAYYCQYNAQAPEPLKNIAQMPLHDLVEHFKKFSLAGLKAISQSNLKN